jgi:glycosyltransferase involved in cell wall biosynthesis
VELDGFATVREQRAAKRAELDLEGGFVILSIARLQPVKGLTDLIGAVALLRDRVDQPLLLVVGGGSQRAELERLVATTGLADLVRLEGEVADPRLYLAAADVFALASTREGLPNALLEAMAAGLPIVATSVGGIPEAVEDGVSGLLVDSADPGALAEAIVQLWKDPDLRRRLGANASRRVAEWFSAETSFRSFRSAMEGAPSGQPAREFAPEGRSS